MLVSHVHGDHLRDRRMAAPGSGTCAEAVTVPVHVPLSGRTMSFDAKGTCVEGC